MLGLGLMLLLMLGAQARETWAQVTVAASLGLLAGNGTNDGDGSVERFGIITSRLQDQLHMGSLALVYEDHEGGLDFTILDDRILDEDVTLNYKSLHVELKRYFPIAGRFLYYWGLRGGISKIEGRIKEPDSEEFRRFETNLFAPLAILAVPLALENPGFLLIGLVDGSSAGLVFDIVPRKIWLDLQLGATLLPQYRDKSIAVDRRFFLATTLQLVWIF